MFCSVDGAMRKKNQNIMMPIKNGRFIKNKKPQQNAAAFILKNIFLYNIRQPTPSAFPLPPAPTMPQNDSLARQNIPALLAA